MAQQTIVHLIDDIDGGDADETVTFGLDGTAYDIDLSKKHAEELRDFLAQYVASARKSNSKSSPAPAGRSKSSKNDQGAIRQWAQDNGFQVKERDRIPYNVIAAYEAAN